MVNMDPVALGWLTQTDLGLMFALAGLTCGAVVAFALIANI
ncbi:MAG: hypothetical protein QXX12_03335 [Nanopusillaceae archaeon]